MNNHSYRFQFAVDRIESQLTDSCNLRRVLETEKEECETRISLAQREARYLQEELREIKLRTVYSNDLQSVSYLHSIINQSIALRREINWVFDKIKSDALLKKRIQVAIEKQCRKMVILERALNKFKAHRESTSKQKIKRIFNTDFRELNFDRFG
ncbi:hypothetical protein JW823_06880 [bacterium]|nr:hypothetical protein [candidate division CSSED10-310 bacterium]